jgi:peptide/nickel transport system permease protein
MIRYVARRLAAGAFLLLLLSVLTFVIFSVLPSGDPAALRAGRSASPETVARIREALGLDEPLPVQYWTFLKRLVLEGDLGYSWYDDAPVAALIADRLPATVALALGAVVIWMAAAIPLGIAAARRPGGWVDRAVTGGAIVAASAPVYWVGLVALYLLADDIGLVPVLPGAGSYVPLTTDPLAWAGSLVLPWLVLASAFAAIYARMLRSSLVATLSQEFVRAARAKGLSERRVMLRHGVRVAIVPLVSLLGIDLGALLGGAVLVETVFNVPGVGRLGYEAIGHADFPVIQGTVLLAGAFVIVANLLVDVAYAVIDPRVRYR